MQKTIQKITQLNIGQSALGYTLLRREAMTATEGTAYFLRHDKTGAEVLYCRRPCENKTFSIAFQTLPEDHTGVFHILEHSVLNGSKKFPVKEPFAVLLQSSMQTFLNAMTYPDKTVYPVSSRNEQDFFNLVQVYLDAVFCPAIYEKPEIFMQEGWHYEVPDAGKAPGCNGVVYSEMKGVFSDVESLMAEETEALLFPDSCYSFCSGGNPKYIPELTYEKFLDAHRRFYHPSNARIFLDGDMEPEKLLEYMDREYLSHYDYREKDFFIREQEMKPAQKTVYYQAEKEDALCHMVLSKIAGKFSDIEENYAGRILCDYLAGSNEAPLQRAFLEAGVGQEAIAEFNDGIYQSFVALKVRNLKKEQLPKVSEILQETVEALCREGLNKADLLASLERFAFHCREVKEPYGLMLGLRALDTWLYGGEPTAQWDTEPIFCSLRKKLETDYFEKLLLKLFQKPEEMCHLAVLPSAEKNQQEEAREQAEMQRRFDRWSPAERAAQKETFDRFIRWQQTPDTQEALACLPKLNIRDIPEEPARIATRAETVGSCPVLQVETDTHGVLYLNLCFRLGEMTTQQLQMANVLCMLLGELSTATYPAAQLQTQMRTWLGGFDAGIELLSENGNLSDCTPYLHIYAKMLEENAQMGLDLVGDILKNTLYTEPDRVAEELKQSDYALSQSLISSGHSYAITRATAPFSVAGTLREALDGHSYVQWMQALSRDFGSKKEEVLSQLRGLQKEIFCTSRLSLGVGGKLPQNLLESFLNSLPQGACPADIPRTVCKDLPREIEIPSSVHYCAMGHNLYAMGKEFHGSASVLSTLLSYNYLWNAVRVQGGAYGTGMAARVGGDLLCYSYRDPNPQSTFRAFREMGNFIEEFCASDAPLEDLIIATVGKSEPLSGPGSTCQLAFFRHLKGTTWEELCRLRREILHTTKEDFLSLAQALKEMAATGAACHVGGKN